MHLHRKKNEKLFLIYYNHNNNNNNKKAKQQLEISFFIFYNKYLQNNFIHIAVFFAKKLIFHFKNYLDKIIKIR